jgi:hypothetical protein
MKTIIFHDSQTGEVKLRAPQCEIRADGTIWHKSGIPIICTAGAPDGDALKSKYQAAVAAKRWADIAPEHYARLGQMAHIIIEDQAAYDARPEHPAKIAARAAAKDAEDNQIRIHLSSRGWGDFSPVEWTGDRRRPTGEIVAECQAALAAGHDVDQPNQTDYAIAAMIEKAKRDSITTQESVAGYRAEILAIAVPDDAVRSYQACNGDPERLPDDIDNPDYWLVRKYSTAIEAQGLARSATIARAVAEIKTAARETSYGINQES